MKLSKILKLPNLTFYLPLLAASTAAMSVVLLAQASVLAAESTIASNLNYQQVSQEQAAATAINVSVNPGRIAVIDFSATDEAISYIGLGDASRVVYNTDFPLLSGTAQTIFLLPIEELDFPGATTTRITNLVAKTIDARGVSRVYNFQINHSKSVANLGIKIAPQTRNVTADVERQVIRVSYGRAANLDDVARGLTIAIAREFTTADDPVVSKVKRFIALARNGELSVVESARSADIDLAVISSLAEMALDQFSFVKRDGNPVSLPVTEKEALSQTENRDEPATNISDFSEKQSVEIESKEEVSPSVVPKTKESSRLIEREEDLSLYLTKQPPRKSSVKEIGIDKRVDYVLEAHDLHFGWQRVLKQGILDIDRQTQAKVDLAINLVRRGSSLKAALVEADLDVQVASFLLAISEGDDEALSSLSRNVLKIKE